MRAIAMLLLGVLISAQPACFLKFWGKGPPPEERIYNVYGEVQSVDLEKLVVVTRHGIETFVFGPASIKGGDFGEGARVHVYYKKREEGKLITMVVEKIK